MSSSSSTVPGIVVAVVVAGILVAAYLNKDAADHSTQEHAGQHAEHAGKHAEHAGHAASDDEHAGYSGSIDGYLKSFSD